MQSLCQGGAKKSKVRVSTPKIRQNLGMMYDLLSVRWRKKWSPIPSITSAEKWSLIPSFSLTVNAINTSLFVYLSIQSNLVHVKEDEFKTGCSLLPSVSARATRRSYICDCELGRFVLLMSLFDYCVLTY